MRCKRYNANPSGGPVPDRIPYPPVTAFASIPLSAPSSPFSASLVRKHHNRNANSNAAAPEYFLVGSLEKFLTFRLPPAAGSSIATADDGVAAVKVLNGKIRVELERLYGDPVDPLSGLSMVGVNVYGMLDKFTYDLLRLFRNTYKETTNLTSNGSPVHCLIKQNQRGS